MPSPLHRLLWLPINFAASGDNVVVPATAGAGISVHRMFVWFAQATTVAIKDGVSTSFTGPMAMAANTGWILDPSWNNEGWWNTKPSNSLIINSSAAVQVSGTIWYVIIE
jgi:hypothetical protein